MFISHIYSIRESARMAVDITGCDYVLGQIALVSKFNRNSAFIYPVYWITVLSRAYSFKIPLFTHRSKLNLFNLLIELLILLMILYTQGIRILSAMDRIGKRVVHYIYVYIACI